MDTRDVAEFVVTASFDKLPTNVVAKAKMCVLDILGGSVAAQETKSATCVREVVQRMGGREESTLIGIDTKVPAPLAAWANGVLASALDIDDGCFTPGYHVGHPGAIVVPASLSVAECESSSVKSLIEAIVVGYEIGIRAGYILSSLYLPEAGPAGPLGCYGAAAASAKLLHLDREETINALHIVHDHNPLPLTGVPSRIAGMTKERVGWAVLTGVCAALLAQRGFTGKASIYEKLPPHEILTSLGTKYEMLNIYHKPYCSCRITHCALDGLSKLIKEFNLVAEDVVSVTIISSPFVVGLNSYEPNSTEQAQFSLPFVIGAMLVDGKVGPDQINDRRLSDKAILDQAKKVKLKLDPTYDAPREGSGPGAIRAIVNIETKDGKYETLIDSAKGSPENPLTPDELRDKFRSLSTRVLGKRRAEGVIKYVDNLDSLSNIGELMSMFTAQNKSK
jgi:2-methylcitrate dehydratase PrpD